MAVDRPAVGGEERPAGRLLDVELAAHHPGVHDHARARVLVEMARAVAAEQKMAVGVGHPRGRDEEGVVLRVGAALGAVLRTGQELRRRRPALVGGSEGMAVAPAIGPLVVDSAGLADEIELVAAGAAGRARVAWGAG